METVATRDNCRVIIMLKHYVPVAQVESQSQQTDSVMSVTQQYLSLLKMANISLHKVLLKPDRLRTQRRVLLPVNSPFRV